MVNFESREKNLASPREIRMKRCGISRPMHSKSLDTAAGVGIRKRVNNIGR